MYLVEIIVDHLHPFLFLNGMPRGEDDWQRLLFRPDLGSSDSEDDSTTSLTCTCATRDPIGKSIIPTLSLDRTCLITPDIIKNILMALLTSKSSGISLPKWINFPQAPRKVIFIECDSHPDVDVFPLCPTHHFRYASTGKSFFHDIFTTSTLLEAPKKKKKNKHRNMASVHKLREKRRDEEEDVIRSVIAKNDLNERTEEEQNFFHDPRTFGTTLHHRQSLGIYESADEDVPSDFLRPTTELPARIPAVASAYFAFPPSYLVSLDCEMVKTTLGAAVARISVIDIPSRAVLYDTLVKPEGQVLSYMTQYSGITKWTLKGVQKTLDEARHDLLKNVIYRDTIVVGHALHNDLRLLRIAPKQIIDISLLYPKFCVESASIAQPVTGKGAEAWSTFSAAEARTLGIEGGSSKAAATEIKRGFQLKLLAFWFLGKHIQIRDDAGHDSIEDAHACGDLFRLKLQNGRDFGLKALLYYTSGEVSESAQIAGHESMQTAEMRGVIERMRSMKSIESKYSSKEFRDSFKQKCAEINLYAPSLMLSRLRAIQAEFFWYEKNCTFECTSLLPQANRIPSLSDVRKYMRSDSSTLIYVTMAKTPSRWNLIELANFFHEECHKAGQTVPPFVVILTKDAQGGPVILFH